MLEGRTYYQEQREESFTERREFLIPNDISAGSAQILSVPEGDKHVVRGSSGSSPAQQSTPGRGQSRGAGAGHSSTSPRGLEDSAADPFSPNKELYQAFVRSAADTQTRSMAERLMQQLSDLSKKVGTLTMSLDHQKRTNESLSSQLKLARQSDWRPDDSTLHKFLIAIRDSSVQLATQLSESSRFPPNDGQLNTAITTISSAMEISTRAVASCRRSLDSVLGSTNGTSSLDTLVADVRTRGVRGEQSDQYIPTSEHNVLSRVIDILGGDSSRYTTLEALRQAAPMMAANMRTSMEQTLREHNTTSVALREYERRSNQMLKACGVSIVPSAQELLENGGVGGRTGFDECLESAQWLSRAIQLAERESGLDSPQTGSLQDRLDVLLGRDRGDSHVLAALRRDVVPLLPNSMAGNASPAEIISAVATALSDASASPRLSPRRQSSGVVVGVEQSDVLLGELVGSIDFLATDSSPEWAALGQKIGVAVAPFDSPSQTSNSRRSVTHGDISRALERLRVRLASFCDAVPLDGRASNLAGEESAAASNGRALHALAQLIPKTTISGAISTQHRSRDGGMASASSVVPPTDSLDEMVVLIAERIDLLHQGLQKSYRQSDAHRVERARVEELIQTKGPQIAKALQSALSSIRFANPDEDVDNEEVEGVMRDGQLPQYPSDSVDPQHTFATFFEPLMADVAARADALRTKCARLGNSHKTDRQRIANYANTQAVMLKRWHKTVGEVVGIARLVGVDSSELVRTLGEEPATSRLSEPSLPPNGPSTVLCADVLRRVQARLQDTIPPEVIEEGARQTELHDLRDKAAVGEAQRVMFAKTISVMLTKLAEVGRSLKCCMFAFGPDDTDYDEMLEAVLAEGRVATSDEDEEALGVVIKKLVKWSARLDTVSRDHTKSLQKLVRYFNGAHAVLCSAEAEVHDANALDADETLVRIADGLLMALNDRPDSGTLRQTRVPHEITSDGEGRFIGADQDHRLMRIHSVVTKLHQSMDALLKGRYLAISGLMDEDAAERTSDSSPSRVQSAFLDIDPETTALTTTELVRLVEQNLRHVDGCLSRFSVGHKQAAICIQKDLDGMQSELATMLGHLSQFDVQETFGIERGDLRTLYDVLKDKPGQRGSYFFNRSENGEGSSPWVTALGYLSQTYGPTLELLASKADSQRWFKRIVDKSMDEAAAYVQWCRDRDVPLPKAIQDNTIGNNEIELIDEHLPIVLNFAAEKAMELHQGSSFKKASEQLMATLEKERRDARAQHESFESRISSLTREVAELHVQKDALISEAAMARAQLRRVSMPSPSHTRPLQSSPPKSPASHAERPRATPQPRAETFRSPVSTDFATTPRRNASPALRPADGYSNRPQPARAPISVSGYALRPSPASQEESLQVVASHPTVKEYVRALCDELEHRHRTSPGGHDSRGRVSPSRRTHRTNAVRGDDSVMGPQTYNPTARSEHHRRPIASANTSVRDHRDSPDRHCRMGTCAHPHHSRDQDDTNVGRRAGRATPQDARPPSPRQRSRSADAGTKAQRVVVMPRTVMIVGPTSDGVDADDYDEEEEVGERSDRRRQSADVSPSMSDVHAPMRSSTSSAGGQVVHIKNSEIAIDRPRRTGSVGVRASSAGRWRL